MIIDGREIAEGMVFRHYKNGKLYRVLLVDVIDAAFAFGDDYTEARKMVIYQDEAGHKFARSASEFAGSVGEGDKRRLRFSHELFVLNFP